jgi:hypothetical protein
MYDSSGAGIHLRKFMGVSLAWWHNYKWVSKRIIVAFSNSFIGPMFHYLNPTQRWSPTTVKHSAASTYLSYIRLAYPSFKHHIDNALANRSTRPEARQLLMNLQHLCEFFIPVVCCSVFLFSLIYSRINTGQAQLEQNGQRLQMTKTFIYIFYSACKNYLFK